MMSSNTKQAAMVFARLACIVALAMASSASAFIYLDTFGFEGPLFAPGHIHGQGGDAETPHHLAQPTIDSWQSSAVTAQQPQIITASGNQILELDAQSRTGGGARVVTSNTQNMEFATASMILNVSSIPTTTQTVLNSARHNLGDLRIPLILQPASGGTQYQVGINAGNSMVNAAFASALLDPFEDYVIMWGWHRVNGTASLWVSPWETEATTPHAAASGGVDIPRALVFNQGGSGRDYVLTIDSLIIASTFAEAYQALIPEPGTFALLALGALGLCVRRRA